MNSKHKNACNDKDNNRPGAGRALLRANTGSFGPATFTFLATLLNITDVDQPITSVTIDTENLRSPIILVEFLGTLTASATVAANVVYTFTLLRTFRNSGFQETLATFTVAQVLSVLGIPDSRGLSFAYTDCFDDCNECATYTLELTSISSTVAVGLEVSVNGTLSVLAVESGR